MVGETNTTDTVTIEAVDDGSPGFGPATAFAALFVGARVRWYRQN